MKKGKFIVIEGGEGAGKTTVVRYIAERLNKENIPVLATREPGGSPIAESIRQSFIDSKLDAISQLYCFAAARAVWVEQFLKPALSEGKTVISDRSFPATYVYQGLAGGLGLSFVKRINDDTMRDIVPDLIIVLDISPEEGMKRSLKSGEINAFENESLSYHEKVNKSYIRLAQKNNWPIVDANKPLESVLNKAYSLVYNVVKEKK